MPRMSLLKGSIFALALPLVLAAATGTALADCKNGFVWRDAKDGDGVCVTPADRTEAKLQNANAANNMKGAGNSGPNTCRDGYVWRDAFGGDIVCVTPFERQKASDQNAACPSHTN